MSQEQEKPRSFIYFQPGQIVFHVTGSFNGDPTDLISWANSLAEKKGISVTPPEVPQMLNFKVAQDIGSITHMQSKNKTYLQPVVVAQQPKLPPFSSIFKTAPKGKIPPPFSLVLANAGSNKWPKFSVDPDQKHQKAQAEAFEELLDLIILLDKNRKSAPVKLEVVSPNWLMSGGPSSPGSTGGPGGQPSPASQADVSKRNFNFASVFPSLIPGLQPEEGRGVVVAILDTSYSIDQLEKIMTDWPQHELITKLLGAPGALRGADGRLRVYSDSIAKDYLPDVKIDGHDYDMTDHGLFVAGIINSLAPQAELHLYQVLNKNGMGDLLSIARALQDIMMKKDDRPIVVNMSLTMNMPLEEEHCTEKDEYKLGLKILNQKPKPEWFWCLIRWFCRLLQWILHRPVLVCSWSWFDRQAISFEWISDLVYVLGPGIIAAAGNNGTNGNRPSALYPAAFDSVLGVGALSRGKPWNANTPLTPASFSNLADTPTTQGVAAFGGEEGKGNGLLGVYVGNTPDGTPNGMPNPTGWAWWAGTSFATPIISGLAAALILNGQAASAQDAVRIVLNTSRRGGITPAFEGIIPVEQH